MCILEKGHTSDVVRIGNHHAAITHERLDGAEEWVQANRIRENLKFGTEQPFYHVLLERDAMPRCCSQENLALLHREDTSVFDHPHAPFYFRPQCIAHATGSIYCNKTFAPSAAMRFVYPEDEAAARAERNYRSLEDAHADP